MIPFDLEVARFVRVPSGLVCLQDVHHVEVGPLPSRQPIGEVDGPLNFKVFVF